jgi:hypothetical protein
VKPIFALSAFAAAANIPGAMAQAQPQAQQQELSAAIVAFESALARNDAAGFDARIASDWVIIEGGGTVIDRASFLATIRSGALVHDAVRFDERDLRLFGRAAIWTARARGSGRYNGAAFDFDERSTDMWIYRDGRWVCVLTQLTPIAHDPAS